MSIVDCNIDTFGLAEFTAERSLRELVAHVTKMVPTGYGMSLQFAGNFQPEKDILHYFTWWWNGQALVREHIVRLSVSGFMHLLGPWLDLKLGSLVCPRTQTLHIECDKFPIIVADVPKTSPTKRPLDLTEERVGVNKRARVEHDDDIQIFIKTLTGHTNTYEVSHHWSCSKLIQAVQEKECMPADSIRLIFAGRQLEDVSTVTLGDMRVQNLSTLHMMSRLRGGMMHYSSGRVDYCSLKPPIRKNGESPAALREVHEIRIYVDAGTLVRLYVHPDASVQHIINVLRAETEQDVFKNMTFEQLQQIYHQGLSTLLSMNALGRFMEACSGFDV